MRAEHCGVKAITVHGRTRQQFYKGIADWRAVAEVKASTRLPVIVNGDIFDADTARVALAQSGADAVMIGRGAQGRLSGSRPASTGHSPNRQRYGRTGSRRTADHCTRPLPRHAWLLWRHPCGVRVFRKHLGWYLDSAARHLSDDVRRSAALWLLPSRSARRRRERATLLHSGAKRSATRKRKSPPAFRPAAKLRGFNFQS